MSGFDQLTKYRLGKESLKLKDFNSKCLTYNNFPDILKMQKKKEKSEFGKGYNTALKKCNKKAIYIMRKMFDAYIEASNKDEDYDEYDEYC